ncbi:MAG: hypothetical protein ACRDKY_08240 [Solirubrobacteraceae bacterium]
MLPVRGPKLVCAHAQELDGRCARPEGIGDGATVVEAERGPWPAVDDGHEDRARERRGGVELGELVDERQIGVARRPDDDGLTGRSG